MRVFVCLCVLKLSGHVLVSFRNVKFAAGSNWRTSKNNTYSVWKVNTVCVCV